MGKFQNKSFWGISMAVLAGSYLLYSLASAEGRFFDSEIKFFEMDKGCKECPKSGRQAEDLLDEQMIEEDSRQTSKITLTAFISLDSPYTERAVASLVRFRKSHSEVLVRGVVILPLKGAKEVLLRHTDVWRTKIPFRVDFALKEARDYKVTCIPTFVFEDSNNAYKVAGQPDLEKIYAKGFLIDKNLRK